ncbi:hypothetical protein XELAEV_18016809mg [Xenopus laevis]|uniref:Uncharacterized protein n=1 Tax=Xenopus laevis TaxID=8355 RepID=A0A974DAG4_XENLA|nr:hypothetical protein XELAEV_18016809mg [Xenopus laevis]
MNNSRLFIWTRTWQPEKCKGRGRGLHKGPNPYFQDGSQGDYDRIGSSGTAPGTTKVSYFARLCDCVSLLVT